MLLVRLFIIALLLHTSACATHGRSANKDGGDANELATGGADEDKDADAEDVEQTPEDLGDIKASSEVSAKEKEADQMSLLTFPLVHNEFVQQWVDYFTGRGRETFEKWLTRSTRYIPLMKQVLKEEGVPVDLIYLSMIESGFNPKAYSHAKAVGPWQFMEPTGKRYGLRVDFWIDERKDIVKSTHAAAIYLKELHAIFGSWYLAAAGYNAGEGRVLSAIRRDKNRNFWELAHGKTNFRAETKNYVPKIIAAALLAKNPEKYGFNKGLDFGKPLAWESVRVPGGVDLRAVAQVTNEDPDLLQILNAELRTGITPPESKDGYDVRVPPEKKDVLLSKLTELSRIQVASFINHRVGRGENLGYIARRYKTTVVILLKLNNINNPKSLRVGQVLKVPLPRGARKGTASYARDFTREAEVKRNSLTRVAKGRTEIKKSQERVLASSKTAYKQDRIPLKKAKTKSAPQPVAKHKVKRGETLTGIANRYRVKQSEIVKENNLKRRDVRIGQLLKIPDGVE